MARIEPFYVGFSKLRTTERDRVRDLSRPFLRSVIQWFRIKNREAVFRT